MSSDIEAYASVDEKDRASAYAAALARLSNGRIGSLTVEYGGADAEELTRRALESPVRESSKVWQGRVRWSDVAADAVPGLVARLYHPRASFHASVAVLLQSGQHDTIFVSSDPGFEAGHPVGFLRLATEFRHVWPAELYVPAPASFVDAIALAARTWTLDVDALLLGLGDAEHDGIRIRYTTAAFGHGGYSDPFSALAVVHANAESLAADFGRAWLHWHAGSKPEDVATWSADALRRAIVEAREHVPRAPQYAVGGYDGSLSRADVLRLLDRSPFEVVEAIEAAAVPDEAARGAFALGAALADALARGSHARPFNLSPLDRGVIRGTPAMRRLRRLAGGGILLGAGPFQPLWPIYRDAATLLLE